MHSRKENVKRFFFYCEIKASPPTKGQRNNAWLLGGC
jgi:hypothetical protein